MFRITTIILAAGEGTRMKSKLPKVLHKVCGKPMVEHVMDVAKEIKTQDILVVIGHGASMVEDAIKNKDIHFVLQKEQLGTGHAVMQTENDLPEEGCVLLLYGDTPLIKTDTLEKLIHYHIEGKYQATILTSTVENPTGYGRIVRDSEGNVLKIIEHKDANAIERKIKEVNSGIYCYDAKLLKKALKQLTNNNAQKEYYITDVIGIFNQEGYKVGVYQVEDQADILGVNSRIELAEAEKIMRKRIVMEWMKNGVTIIDPENTYIEKDVRIGVDTILYPGVILKGKTVIGEDCVIGHNCRIENSTIKDRVEIQSSTIIESFVGNGCHIGPYAYLRPNSRLGKHVKIGDFVEVKNSIIGDGSKASHLAYIGDAEVGKNVNIGCGVVFVNYDGKQKYKTIVEDYAFVGSNVNLVAPVIVKKNAYIATGSTTTNDVPEGVLSVARARQRNIPGWVERKGLLKDE